MDPVNVKIHSIVLIGKSTAEAAYQRFRTWAESPEGLSAGKCVRERKFHSLSDK